MNHKSGRSAFTLLEVIFVIVILGIVASLGSELIVKVYQQYIVQRAQHRASIKTELAATQIANRLASAIPGTVYRIKNDDTYESFDSNFSSGSNDDSYKGLQWVGADTDSFSATGWSGFCDVDNIATLATSLETPGSALVTVTKEIIKNLSGSYPTTGSLSVYFPYDTTPYPATITDVDTIKLEGTGATHIVEHYKLAWSSYALVVTNGDLFLHYNFAPTPGVNGTAVGGSSSLLMKNISTFKFKGAGRTIRFKICKEEEIGEDFNITACKEKAVF